MIAKLLRCLVVPLNTRRTETSYGTHLFWPLGEEWVAWNLIAIIDPVFTLALLTAVIVALVKRALHIAWLGLTFTGLYLSLGWIQQCAISCHRPA